jgi:hypothetical protein
MRTKLNLFVAGIAWLAWWVDSTSGFVFIPQQQQHQCRRIKRTILSVASAVETPPSSPPTSSNAVDVVEFPPPLTPVDRFKRAATFWSTAIPIVANYYGIIGKIRMQELIGSKMSDEEIEVCVGVEASGNDFNRIRL